MGQESGRVLCEPRGLLLSEGPETTDSPSVSEALEDHSLRRSLGEGLREENLVYGRASWDRRLSFLEGLCGHEWAMRWRVKKSINREINGKRVDNEASQHFYHIFLVWSNISLSTKLLTLQHL